jgi:hypothetical protein
VKRGINRFLLRVVRMVVLPFSVGLPDLNHGVVDGNSISIKNPACNAKPFSFGLGCDKSSHGSAVRATQVKERPDGLGGSRRRIQFSFQTE